MPADRRPLRVEAVVSGRLAASTRFRVLQHVDPLAALGVAVTARPPRVSKYARVPDRMARRRSAPMLRLGWTAAKLASRAPAVGRSWAADVTWLEREMLPGQLSLEPLLHRPLVFDVDDAIWLLSAGHERAARWAAAHSACVVAGNDFLADWASGHARRVERVWTAVDTDRFRPRAAGRAPGFVLGWTGSSSTLHYLEALDGPLSRVLAEAPDARLVVVADRRPHLPSVPAERLELVPWSPDTEADAVAGFDVGLAPLRDTPWARGKCAFKLVQYLACAVAVVASPYGMNRQVLELGEVGVAAEDDDAWVEALLALHADRDRTAALGRAGRAVAEAHFARPTVARQLAGVLLSAAGRPPPGGDPSAR